MILFLIDIGNGLYLLKDNNMKYTLEDFYKGKIVIVNDNEKITEKLLGVFAIRKFYIYDAIHGISGYSHVDILELAKLKLPFITCYYRFSTI